MRAQTTFVSYQSSNRLCVLSSDQRVVENELVKRCAWIFEVKLHQFNLVSEDVKRDFNTLSNCNELVISVIDCHWLNKSAHF